MKNNEYRVRIQEANGERRWKIIFSATAQEAADNARIEVKGCEVLVVAKVVENWR